MSSGKVTDPLTFKKGHMEGAGKIRCPKCHDYAIKKNVNGQVVYMCRCGRAFTTTS